MSKVSTVKPESYRSAEFYDILYQLQPFKVEIHNFKVKNEEGKEEEVKLPMKIYTGCRLSWPARWKLLKRLNKKMIKVSINN